MKDIAMTFEDIVKAVNDSIFNQASSPYTNKQRLTTEEWKMALLNNLDTGHLFGGRGYVVIGKDIGFGVVELHVKEAFEK